jgi:hypothetical protein
VLFIRAQSTIRADSFSSAQHRNSAITMVAQFKAPRIEKQANVITRQNINMD